MKRLIPILILISPVLAVAEPSSNIAWTPEKLEFVKNGDARKGKKLAQTCSGCHGEKGVSPGGGFPSLAGQLATYTFKQLRDYSDAKRANAMMNAIAQGLSEQDSADLAAWYASLPPAEGKESDAALDKAEVLVKQGDGKRQIPSCFVCHGGRGQGEKQHIPALAGQQSGYLINTLNDYKKGNRHNDIYGRMRSIALQLSEEEIKQLAQYYHQMKR